MNLKDKKQLLWDLSVQVSELSIEISELKKLTVAATNACPNWRISDGLRYGEPHFHNWFEEAKDFNCRVEELEGFGECHYCLDAYQKVQERKKLQIQRGYLRSKITKLVRGGV